MKNNLEARIESLEKRVAALENQITNKVSPNNRLEQLAEDLLNDAFINNQKKELGK
ncbi:MAG: hypothetical protein HFG18_11180 [Oscillospiraceae bacterium]|nr:hypothetical protein [Oscillospiraceae bacterium]